MSSKSRIWLIAILATLVLPPVAWAVANPGAARTHLTSRSDFRKLDERLFASPSFADGDLEHLTARIRDAEARVGELFGAYSANPWILVAADADSAARYDSNLQAAIHAIPFGRAYVVLGPEGLSSTDVIAHELAHAEHLERVGHFLWWLTPTWFIEGLAMQVDHRPQYAEATIGRVSASGDPVPKVQEMFTVEQFNRGDLKLNYATARREVSHIYSHLGPSGLSSFLRGQRLGESFSSWSDKASVAMPVP